MECAIILCTTLGLRRGEVVGLSWEDVNFEDHTVTVRHSFDKFGNLKAPKTASGVRILPMSACTEKALRKCQASLIEEYGPKAPCYTFQDKQGASHLEPKRPVITDKLANRATPNNLSNWWEHHRKDYGMQGYTLHELRHTFLTLAAEKGVHPSVMQKLAGHKNPNITLGIYTHVNMREKRTAMDALQEVFA